MDHILNGGLYLVAVALLVAILAFVAFNWRWFHALLFESGQSKAPFAVSLARALAQIKTTLLYFAGASKVDLSSNSANYLNAITLEETYFAQNKFRSAWQIFSYYMFYSLVMVFIAKPIDIESSKRIGHLVSFIISKDAPAQVLHIVILTVTNVITDLMSLAVTFVMLNRISLAFMNQRYFRAAFISVLNLLLAFLLFSVSQLVSNFLYPLALENPPANYDPLTIQAAMMPYAFLRSAHGANWVFYDFTFPGQIFITGTIFFPTLVSMVIAIVVSVLIGAGHLVNRAQSVVLGTGYVPDGLGPIPIAGGDIATLKARSDRCFHFAVLFMMGTLQTITATVIAAIIIHLFQWA